MFSNSAEGGAHPSILGVHIYKLFFVGEAYSATPQSARRYHSLASRMHTFTELTCLQQALVSNAASLKLKTVT